jgi:RND family efflux transporter MFP subunit
MYGERTRMRQPARAGKQSRDGYGMRTPAGGVLLLGMLALAGCDKKAAPAAGAGGPQQAMPVSTMQVQASNVPLTGEWVGTMDGYVNAQIQPQVSGYLIRQTYREGSPVAKGQVLFQIDPRPFQAALEQAQGQQAQAQAQVAQAQAQLSLANTNVARDTPLAQAHAIATSQLDTETQQKAVAAASVSAAEAGVRTAQAGVSTAKLNLGFTQVRSLISGVAGQAMTQVGNLVGPQSVLTSVSDLNPIKVFFSISDSEYLALTQRARSGGGSLLAGSANIPLTLTLSNGEVYPSKGRIVFVDRQLNAQTGAIRIAAAFPNPRNELRPGQFARVKAETEVRHDVILVPQVAVQELQGIEQVYTVGAGNKVHVVNVKLGQQFGNDWIVDSGLAPGTTIITDNLQKLREGAPVSPHPGPSPDAGTAAMGQTAGR